MNKEQLELAYFGMTIARTQLKTMALVAKGMQQVAFVDLLEKYELQLQELCDKIRTGVLTV